MCLFGMNPDHAEGPTGLTILKTLREDGFDVTLYERRSHVGGLWAYSENPSYTTALAGEINFDEVVQIGMCAANLRSDSSKHQQVHLWLRRLSDARQ
jgi:cation diffusion facilitator CzcD-associated flavoprotein CzcO